MQERINRDALIRRQLEQGIFSEENEQSYSGYQLSDNVLLRKCPYIKILVPNPVPTAAAAPKGKKKQKRVQTESDSDDEKAPKAKKVRKEDADADRPMGVTLEDADRIVEPPANIVADFSMTFRILSPEEGKEMHYKDFCDKWSGARVLACEEWRNRYMFGSKENPLEAVTPQAVEMYEMIGRTREDGAPKTSLVTSLKITSSKLFPIVKQLVNRGFLYLLFFWFLILSYRLMQ